MAAALLLRGPLVCVRVLAQYSKGSRSTARRERFDFSHVPHQVLLVHTSACWNMKHLVRAMLKYALPIMFEGPELASLRHVRNLTSGIGNELGLCNILFFSPFSSEALLTFHRKCSATHSRT